ncbi:MAG TPA: hypothetical protein ENK39_09875 [Epsilonproteobacteria bacterium]|nr:hypothetical protein [Campylobacterota bacterium]
MLKEHKDLYESFKDLQKNEVGNYTIEYLDRGSNITILAPHGGKIEFNTTEIAKLIAGDSFNYYSFIGQKNKNNRHLHITSHKFNEPIAKELVGKSKIVIAIHGCSDKQGKNEKDYGKHIFIGGLDEELKNTLQEALLEAGLSIGREKFQGMVKDNICNVGKRSKGVQFELTKSFRGDAEYCGKFIEIVGRILLTNAS